MADLLAILNEVNTLRRKVDDLATREYVTAQNNLIVAGWLDAPLLDPTNASHFNDNTNSFPAGWTQAAAAAIQQTNDPVGFWNLGGSSVASWKFRRQSPFTIEGLASNATKSFWVGPILLKDATPTANLTYHLGVYRNNAGIDENTYVRAELNWDAATSVWRVRGERKDGTTVTSGAYTTLGRFPVAPIWFRVMLKNDTNKTMRVMGVGMKHAELGLELMSATIGSGVTWGQVWWQFHLSRGAGNPDRVAIGGIDYSDHA